MYPWGKVQGVNGDYWIAQGRDEFLETPVSFFRFPLFVDFHRLTFFSVSIDGVNWAQLPDVDDEALEKCNKLQVLLDWKFWNVKPAICRTCFLEIQITSILSAKK